MSDPTRKPFLSRWSQRKLAASREAARAEGAAVVTAAPPAANAVAPAPAAPASEAAAVELPPVESLSFDSDFTPFLKPKVDEAVKRDALRKLFSDPRFNVMDGLDVYIDDYGKTIPVTPEILAKLNHAKFLFDPPKTRVNAQGHVEDVPPEPTVAEERKEGELASSADGEPQRLVDDRSRTAAANTPSVDEIAVPRDGVEPSPRDAVEGPPPPDRSA